MLTPKQARFVDEYLVDLNASAAAKRAGYSVRTANRMASENLSKPDIATAIVERRTKLAEQTGRTIAAVMADIGRVRDDAMRCIDGAVLSHKDALKALELEGKHLGAFEKDNAQKAGGFVQLLATINGRG